MPRKKHEQSQAGSVFQLALFVEEMTDHVQSSTLSLPQEQEMPAKRVINYDEIQEFADYIRDNTNWIKLWNMIYDITHDQGLSHEGGSNFLRSAALEQTIVDCILNAYYVDGLYDFGIQHLPKDKIELKMFKNAINKNGDTKKFTVKNGRPGKAKTEEQKNVAFKVWLNSNRHDFLMLVDYETRRVFVTSEDVIKNNAVDGTGGIQVSIPANEMIEVLYQNTLPDFYDSFFEHGEVNCSHYYNEAFRRYQTQYEGLNKYHPKFMNSPSET